jgi:hypothetical protein
MYMYVCVCIYYHTLYYLLSVVLSSEILIPSMYTPWEYTHSSYYSASTLFLTPVPSCLLFLVSTLYFTHNIQQQHTTTTYNNNDKNTPRRPTTYHMRSLRHQQTTTRSIHGFAIEPPNIRIRQNASIQAV